MAAILLNATELIGPATPQLDLAVGPSFERFDGLEGCPPLENPAGWDRTAYFPTGPRPGQSTNTADTYTPGPISGTVGVVDGQPLPVSARIFRPPGQVTLVNTPSIQKRMGVGQNGPSALGAAQTVALSEITNSPPMLGDITSIIAGLA